MHDEQASNPSKPSKPSKPPQHERRLILILTLVGIACVVAYIPALAGGFIWDDDAYVTENETLRSLDGLRRIWFEKDSIPQWYPLVHSTFWVEYHLWGLHPLGYHIDNLLLHLGSVLLLVLLLRRLEVPGALLAASLFALHPVHVESVAWITERKNVLSLVFYLLSLLCYLRFTRASFLPCGVEVKKKDLRTSRRWSFYFLSLGLFLLALFSKTVTCSLPAVILLLVWWKRTHIGVEDLLPLLAFFALGMFMAWLTSHQEKHRVGAVGTEWDINLLESCLVAGRGLWFYAQELLWPMQQIFIYPKVAPDTGQAAQYLPPLAAVAVIGTLFLWRQRLGRGPLVAVLMFAGTLLPALGFIAVYPFRYSYVADHFQYHASLGLIVLASALATRLCLRLSGTWQKLGYVLATAVLVFYGARVYELCHQYKDKETLYRTILSQHPDSWFAHNNLAAIFHEQGDYEKSFAYYKRTKELNPKLDSTKITPDAWALCQVAIMFGKAYKRAAKDKDGAAAKMNFEQATARLEQALAIHPDYPLANETLGGMLVMNGQFQQGLAYLYKALELNPRDKKTRTFIHNFHCRQAESFRRQGRIEEMNIHLEAAKRLRDTDPER